MAERGGGMDVRGGDDDAPETELEVSYAAETAGASGFGNGVFLVSDPLAGPPLGSPTPKMKHRRTLRTRAIDSSRASRRLKTNRDRFYEATRNI